MDAVLGIDIAKAKFDVALQGPDGRVRRKSCANTPAGFRELEAWLRRHGATHVHACLEATGTYGDALATWLYDAGHRVSVVNPMMIHAFAASQLSRTKTDRTDAALHRTLLCDPTARASWTPTPREIRELQALVRRLEALHEMRTQETNRLASGAATTAVAALDHDGHRDADRRDRRRAAADSRSLYAASRPPQSARPADVDSRHRGGDRGRACSPSSSTNATAARVKRPRLRASSRALSNRARCADRAGSRKSARAACGRRSIFRRSPRCAAIPPSNPCASACAPREKCRWSSSGRPCAN